MINQSANDAEAHATFRESHYQTASIQCMPIHDICIYYSMTFDPSNALHSGVLSTKFGGHRALLSKLTLPDPS